MALDRISLPMIAPLLKSASVLCLAYPDLALPVAEVEQVLGIKVETLTPFGRDHKKGEDLAETMEAFRLAGALSVDCVDVQMFRGCERIVDLNQSDALGKEQYDLVINPGTIEHCFNVAGAMFNAWRATKVGGHVLHVAPLNMLNHGFWNICPTVFEDFCEANGGAVVSMVGADRAGNEVQIGRTGRFRVASEAVLYALVRKLTQTPERIPTQWRYR